MGFDIYGINPRSSVGQYFRNNLWRWKPLWSLICFITPELTERNRYQGQINCGHAIMGEKHQAIIRNLEAVLHSTDRPSVDLFVPKEIIPNSVEASMIQMLGSSVDTSQTDYHFEWDNVQSFLEFCQNNDGFEIR